MNNRRRLSIEIGSLIFALQLAFSIGLGQVPRYGSAKLVGHLEHKKIDESSGLAVSRRHQGLFWTHNDSGDEARLFAFDAGGKHHGTCHLLGAEADDWEDMGSFSLDNEHFLFVGDVGDNAGHRRDYVIYVATEPASPKLDTQVTETIVFTYRDGRQRDCEAVGLDVARRQFLLIEKQRVGIRSNSTPSACHVWQLGWIPGRRIQRTVAQKIATIEVPSIDLPVGGNKLPLRIRNAVTGLDVSADGRRSVISTYGASLIYERHRGQTWSDAFSSPGHSVEVPTPPIRIQGESICFGSDGVTLYLTSEKKPCPLFVVPHLNAR